MEVTPSCLNNITPCERKATRPSIIAPTPRPVSQSVAATGSRKLPAAASLHCQQKPEAGTSLQDQKRNIIKELGLDLSSDDEAIVSVPPPKKPAGTILIPPQHALSTCKYRLVRGGKKGLVCGKKCVKGKSYCAVHLKKPVVSTKVETSVGDHTASNATLKALEETTAKLKTLEKIVVGLLKNDKKAVCESKDTQTVSTVTSSSASSANIPLQKPKKKNNIQRIRIYKLNQDETYKLLRYKDGMPIVRSTKNRLFQIRLPNYMSRPIPNNRWALVCDPELPQMVWKEV